MPNVKFTEGRIREFEFTFDPNKPGINQIFFRDSETSGLTVRVTRNSKKYVLDRRHRGKLYRITIGHVKNYNLLDAKKEARRLIALIDQGVNPNELKVNEKLLHKQKGILALEIWNQYLDAKKPYWSEVTFKEAQWYSRPPSDKSETGPLWVLLNRPASCINMQTVSNWIGELKKNEKKKNALIEKKKIKPMNYKGKGTKIKKSYKWFITFWRWAYSNSAKYGKLADPSKIISSELKSSIPKSSPKNDVLEKSQLKPWFDSVNKIENPVISAYLQVLLLTGARRNELACVKWDDISFKWNSISLSDKVEESGRIIPLTAYCKYLISRLPKENDFVFSSLNSKTGHIVEPRIAHNKAKKIVGLPDDLSIHGLRRSFSSLSEWLEMPVGIMAQIMGHRPSATAEKHYKRRPLELLLKWHQKFEDWVLKEANIDFNPETISGKLKLIEETTNLHGS